EANSLYVYLLIPEEEQQLSTWISKHNTQRTAALTRLAHGVSPTEFEAIAPYVDADEWGFLRWPTLLADFQRDCQDFALDLCAPSIGSPPVVSLIEETLGRGLPNVFRLDDPCAALRDASGGKGYNLHVLRHYRRA